MRAAGTQSRTNRKHIGGAMVFNSLTFAVFFACVLLLHNLPFSWTVKKVNLLIASYLFYAAWNPPFVILLWVSTVVDWWAAQGLVRAQRPAARRAWMLLSVVANIGMLGFFKYGQFLLDNFSALMNTLGIAYQPPHYAIVLPVGISFYTFATMSYTLDVYLRRALPAQRFLDYALFVTFFPHLVAGPIMRPTELVPQFAEPRRANAHQLSFGLALMTLGLFQKVVLADGFLAPIAERVYDQDVIPGALDAWAATLAFGGQIFCDFAGYSTTAIGAAMCLGFAMPDNFRFPYAAIGFSDFWRRWHITLSAWLRDYLYILLGGNRHGEARTYFRLIASMLLGEQRADRRAHFAQALRPLSARSRSLARPGSAYLLSDPAHVGFLPCKDLHQGVGRVAGFVWYEHEPCPDPAWYRTAAGRHDRRRDRGRTLVDAHPHA